MVGSVLGMVGLNFAIESGLRLMTQEVTYYGKFSLYVISASIIIKEVLAQITIRMGKKLNSQSLIADGWHHRTDSISSAIILIGVIFGGIAWWFDGVAGLGVSIMIIYAAYEIIKDTIGGLLGEKADAKMLTEIIEISAGIDVRISSIHNLKLHSYGDHKELNLDIRLPESMSVLEAHNIADSLERAIHDKYTMKATVHIEPGIIRE
jgi:cation diffusion facilitator family transporter